MRVNYMDFKGSALNEDGRLIARTLRLDSQSWFLLRMGVSPSTVGQMFVPSNTQETALIQLTAKIMTNFRTLGAAFLVKARGEGCSIHLIAFEPTIKISFWLSGISHDLERRQQ